MCQWNFANLHKVYKEKFHYVKMGNPSEDTAKDDFEIGDVETYGSSGDSGFSHQTLVMGCMRRALENGAKEMRPGWFENKVDKHGNMSRVYNEDTRESFISSVEACLMAMDCDLDKDAAEDIKKLTEEIETTKKNLLDEEKKEWGLLNPMIRRNLISSGKGFISGYFNRDKRFFQLYLEEKVRVYREILKALSRLTQRIDFYKEEIFEA
jgi:hypothetical protein